MKHPQLDAVTNPNNVVPGAAWGRRGLPSGKNHGHVGLQNLGARSARSGDFRVNSWDLIVIYIMGFKSDLMGFKRI